MGLLSDIKDLLDADIEVTELRITVSTSIVAPKDENFGAVASHLKP